MCGRCFAAPKRFKSCLTSTVTPATAGNRPPLPTSNKNGLNISVKNPHLFTTRQRRCGLRNLSLLKLRLELSGRATAQEIANALGKALKHVYPRLEELEAAGLIRDTGLRVHGKGRPATLWADCKTTQKEHDLAAFKAMELSATANDDAPDWFKNFGQ